jgi:hypothetical protein
VIGVLIGLWLGILGRATAFTLGWGICTLLLGLSLWVWECEWGRMMNDEKTEGGRWRR